MIRKYYLSIILIALVLSLIWGTTLAAKESVPGLENVLSSDTGLSGNISADTSASRRHAINYIIQRGDTLKEIANRFNTSVDQLKQLNGLKSNGISPGKIIQIVVAPPSEREDPSEKISLRETKLSIIIMCRVVDSLLLERLGPESIHMVNEFMGQRGGCKGYWIPQTGILFNIATNLTLIPQSQKKEKEEKQDLWEKYEEQLHHPSGSPGTPFHHYQKNEHNREVEMNIRNVRILEHTILEVLAKYGHRLKGVDEDQKVIFLITGIKETHAPGMYGMIGMGMGGDGMGGMSSMNEEMMEGRGDYFGGMGMYGNNVPGSAMIIQIEYKDLPKAEGEIEDIEDKVQITTY